MSTSGDGFGKRWFVFWTYVCYPLSAILALLLAFGSGKPYWAVLCVLLVGVTYGLHKRQLWAWQANWIVLVGSFGSLFLPAYRELVPLDTWIIQLVVNIAFLVANWFYWDKRKAWFKHDPGQMLIWSEREKYPNEGTLSERERKMLELSEQAKGHVRLKDR